VLAGFLTLQVDNDPTVLYSPLPSYLRYQPEVGFAIPLSDIFKPEETDTLTGQKGS